MNGHNIDDVVIPMLCCDFDQDKRIGSLDAKEVLTHIADNSYMYMDMDGDERIGSLDAKFVLTLIACSYQDTIVIE